MKVRIGKLLEKIWWQDRTEGGFICLCQGVGE